MIYITGNVKNSTNIGLGKPIFFGGTIIRVKFRQLVEYMMRMTYQAICMATWSYNRFQQSSIAQDAIKISNF